SSAGPTVSCCWRRTNGMRRRRGSRVSFSSQRSSESSAALSPSSVKRFASRSIRACTPNCCAKRRSSPSEAARSFRSTKCVVMRRSAKKRRAARVSALFRTPKIWTSTLAARGEPQRAEVHQSLERLAQPGHVQARSLRQLLERPLAELAQGAGLHVAELRQTLQG